MGLMWIRTRGVWVWQNDRCGGHVQSVLLSDSTPKSLCEHRKIKHLKLTPSDICAVLSCKVQYSVPHFALRLDRPPGFTNRMYSIVGSSYYKVQMWTRRVEKKQAARNCSCTVQYCNGN